MASLSTFAAAEPGASPVRVQLDGEIYNAPRLRELVRGHDLEAPADPAGLVKCLYELYGVELVHAIDGKFAIAIADGRDGSVLLARDRFGQRPLFHRLGERGLEFASGTRELGVAAEAALEPSAVAEYLERGAVAAPQTIFAGVEALGPGQLLRWRPGAELKLSTYWRPPEPTGGGLETIDEVLEELQRLLERSIAARLGAGPCAVLDDGGVAAALVAALLARAGVEHRLLAPAPAELVPLAEAAVSSLDQPLADPGLIALAAAARRADGVALAVPLGADEFFGPDLDGHRDAGGRRGLAARLRREPVADWPDAERGRIPAGLAAAADRFAASAGVELRAPFLEQEVAELAMTVLAQDQMRGGGGALLRTLLSRVGGEGGGGRLRADAAEWLRGPLRDPAAAILAGSGPAFAEGWLDSSAAGLDGDRLWRAFVFARWLQAWRDGDGR